MTLEEMRTSDVACLRPADVAEVLGCHPYAISLGAKDGTLPFPYFRSGNRTKIPRNGFLNWIDGRFTQTGRAEAETKRADAP